MVRRWPVLPTLMVLLLGLVVAALLGVRIGPMALSWTDLGAALRGDDPMASLVLRELRLPRVLLGMVVGASLAVCGALMQGLFRNPLADPGLIGVSAGAALGAVSMIVLGPTVLFGLADHPLWLPAAAFVGAMLAMLVVWHLGRRSAGESMAGLLLAGVAVNALAGAATGVMTYLADDAQLRSLTFWTMGSLGGADGQALLMVLPAIVVLCLAPGLSRVMNLLALGERSAAHLGYDMLTIKRYTLVLCALAVGCSVAVSGMIGFVGLVAPHLVRLALGPDHRALIPAAALIGALLLVLADLLARTIVAPAELPIGLVTALLGGPFFLYLLHRQRLI